MNKIDIQEQMIPRPEHPFPQFERVEWMNLNGTWEFEYDYSASGQERRVYQKEKLEKQILVPFCPESTLSGVENRDFLNCVWYQRHVVIPEEWENRRILLHFGAVDYETTVYVNQQEVGIHQGGYSSFSMEITKFLLSGENVITVCAKDDVRTGHQPAGKQSERYDSYRCLYTRTTGIWQTVWLEAVPQDYIEKVKYYPDCTNRSVTLKIFAQGSAQLDLMISYEGKEMGRIIQRLSPGTNWCTVPLQELFLWEPGHGRLYDVEIRYGEDRVHSYFGMRSVRLEGRKFLINEKSVFQRLVLDQGYYPDGIYTAPTEEALVKDIEISMEMGFNGARLHEKVFEPRFLYHCDKKGYIVWGEHANWGLDITEPFSIYPFLKEWLEVVERDFNHPSIIGWCPFNETWDIEGRKQYDELLRVVYRTTKALDTTRPCIDTSGNFHVETDIFDVHDYEQDVEIFKTNYDRLMSEGILVDRFSERQTYRGEPCFMSEFGGIRSSFEEGENWGYGQAPKDREAFMERYRGLVTAMLDNSQMFGFCYTQLYDVESETNGLYSYERQPKFDLKEINRINTQKAAIEG